MQSWLRSFLLLAPLTVAPLALAAPAQADFLVGMVAYERADFATAYRELSAPDTRNAAEAQLYLGRMHLFGQGVAKDEAQGIALLEQAAAGNVVEAVTMLAKAYEFGMGAAKDKAKALAYWEQAAALGVTSAQVEMGLRYESGEVTGQPDYDAALRWYREAVAANDARAMTYLGSLYERGLGVAQDLALAAELYRQAVGKGHALAMNKLAQLLIATDGDLDEARHLAETAVAREGQPLFHATLGRVLELQGDVAGAEAAYREAAKRSPLFVAPREALGDLYWAQGRKLDAQAAWKEALGLARKPGDKQRLEQKLRQATF
jgi:TPR repeat protein